MNTDGAEAFRHLSLAASQDPAMHLTLSTMPLYELWTTLTEDPQFAEPGNWSLIPGSARRGSGNGLDPTPALFAANPPQRGGGLLAVVIGEDPVGSPAAAVVDPSEWRFTALGGGAEPPSGTAPTPTSEAVPAPASAPAPAAVSASAPPSASVPAAPAPTPANRTPAPVLATDADTDAGGEGEGAANFCPECGTAARGARRFCGSCGSSLIGGERHPSAVAGGIATSGAHGVDSGPASLTNPVTIQGRTAPMDVWLLVGSAWFGTALFALLGLLVVRVSVDYLGNLSVWSLFSGLSIALIGAIALAFGALLAWLGIRVLDGDATAPWLGVAAGGVLLSGTLVYAVTTRSLGQYPLLTLGLMLVSGALIGFGAFSPGVRAHTGLLTAQDPPMQTVVSVGLSRWLLFLFAVNGVISLAYLIAALGSGYAEFKLLPLGIILLAAAGAVFWASQTVLGGDPTARLVLTGAAGFAALAYVLLNDSYGNGAWFGWVQVCIAVAIIVLLWLPASSEFFRNESGANL